MAGNVNLVAATVGVFSVFGLLLLFLVRRSRRAAKRKDSGASDPSHVDDQNSRPFYGDVRRSLDDSTANIILKPQIIIYRYLYRNYWNKKHRELESLLPGDLSYRDFKQVHRVTHTSPPILVIYSKKSVWELSLSERVEQGHKEQFSFFMRGPESASNKERIMKLNYVVDDLIRFRKVNTNIMPEFLRETCLFTKKVVAYLRALKNVFIYCELRNTLLMQKAA